MNAEELVADEYEEIKSEVINTVAGKLSARGVTFVRSDLDASYNEAWHALYMKLESGEAVENHKGLLVTIAYRRALSEHRAFPPGPRAGEEELATLGVEPDLDARMDAEIQLQQFVQGLRANLSARELQAAALCHLHGLTRPEAAAVIGVKPRRMEKIMDGASSRIQSVIGQVRGPGICDDFDSMIRAYAVGLLDEEGERYKLAQDHLDGCPSCRRQVLKLRGLASALPPVPALFALIAGSTASAGAGAVAGVAGAGSASSSGSTAGAGAAGAASGGRRGVQVAMVAGATVAVAAVVAIAAVALGPGGGEPSSPSSEVASTAGASSSAEAAAASQAKAEAKAKARAKAKAKAAAQRRRQAAKRREAIARQRQVAAEAAAPPVVAPVEPAPVPPAAAVAPPPPSPPKADPEPRPEPKSPIRDAAVEFELR